MWRISLLLIDDRVGSKELLPIILSLGLPAELSRLEYGDVAFEGKGPDGPIAIGIERKTLNDMLSSIEDSRYAAHQRPGMLMLYSKSFLCLEGLWAAGETQEYKGTLMQGYRGGSSWGPLKTRGNRQVLYSKLYRYLVSVSLSGVIITQSSNLYQTAYNICELFQYFQKRWTAHTSLIEVQKLAIPVMNGKPSLVRRWAQEIDDVGVVYGQAAERKFKTPYQLANSDELAWLSLTGEGLKSIGVGTAQKIIRDIRGWKK